MMKKLNLISTVLIILFASCNYDSDDRINPEEMNQESSENQFVTPEGEIYFTGTTECTSNGTYSFDSSNLLNDLEIPSDLPDTFDLSPLLPPIGNQGRQGSCVSWATTYYLKSIQEKIESGLPYNPSQIMSPAYTYNQITEGICEGTSITSALEILKEQGTTSIESFPYFDNTCSIQPTEEQTNEASINKISDYKHLSGNNMIAEMKTLINQQLPILLSTFLTSEFGKKDNLDLTAYREHTVDFDMPGGCHALLVVGYSDEFNAFKAVNSWGASWGDAGFVWIDYAAFDNVLDDTAEFRVIKSALVAYDL